MSKQHFYYTISTLKIPTASQRVRVCGQVTLWLQPKACGCECTEPLPETHTLSADTADISVLVFPPFFFFFLKILFIYFLETGEGKEKERERNSNVWLPLTCSLLGTQPTTQACALTGSRTCDLLVCTPALHPLSHTSQRFPHFLEKRESGAISSALCVLHLPACVGCCSLSGR